jgi:hypothetical protein
MKSRVSPVGTVVRRRIAHAMLAIAVLLLGASTAGAGTKPKKTTEPPPVKEERYSKKESALLPALRTAALTVTTTAPGSRANDPRAMKLLVLAGDGLEPGFAAIKDTLNRIGIPYDAVIRKDQLLPPLSDPLQGNYQGIIMTTDELGYSPAENQWVSALTPEDSVALAEYAAAFRVRTVLYYCYPKPDIGMNWGGTSLNWNGDGTTANFTASASTVFGYLNRANPVPIKLASVYLGSLLNPQTTGETTTPILTSPQGNPLLSIHKKADGREYLVGTYDNDAYVLHTLAFNYGLINWVTKGVFLGTRKIYLSPQIDDLFLANDLYVDGDPLCQPSGFLLDPTYDPADNCPTHRIDGSDLTALKLWQDGVRAQPQTARFRSSFAFNGLGANTRTPAQDSLTQTAKSYPSAFFYVNHTFTHEDLDCYEPDTSGGCTAATYAQSYDEVRKNKQAANSLGLNFEAQSMVTPGISGLRNPNFIAAAYALNVRNFVGDISRMPVLPPNTGLVNPLNSAIFEVPRYATNIFYNVTTELNNVPGSEPDEYNYFYGPGGISATFQTPQSYNDILERESSFMLRYMLQFSAYPLMFHQSNVDRFIGNRSLYSDLIDRTLQKFRAISTLNVTSLSQMETTTLLKNRMLYNASGASGVLRPGYGVTIQITNPGYVPITGVCGRACETYGGQRMSFYNNLVPGTPVTILF